MTPEEKDQARANLLSGALIGFLVAALFFGAHKACAEQIPSAAQRYRPDLMREAQFVFGLQAPMPALAGQIEQESGWNAGVTAYDNGRGLAQFMDPTAKWASEKFADLGPPDPYNPKWAMRALVRLDDYNAKHVAGETPCERWGAALKGYNAGLGYVRRAQKRSSAPGRWFGATEQINAGQSPKNFEYSRMYPRWILIKRQPKYSGWGTVTCGGLA